MSVSRHRMARLVAPLLPTVLTALALYSLVAVNAAPEPAISGASLPADVTVSDVSYTLDPVDLRRIVAVSLTINAATALPSTSVVQVKLLQLDTSYASCVLVSTGTSRWRCPLAGVSVVAADQLSVRLLSASPLIVPRGWLPLMHRSN